MSLGAGGIDWAERWRAMVAAAGPAVGDGTERDPWLHRALRFDRIGREHPDSALERLCEGMRSTDLVADLGAGAGRHAVPMARRCARLFAVEPSAAMRERLEARIDEEQAQVTVIAESFPCPLPTVDVAYSCHVLYGVADAATFLERMTLGSRRLCRLLLGLRAPSERLAPLFRALHGDTRGPRPAALEALALLHQLGYAATLRLVERSSRPMTFLDTSDDLDELCHRLRLAPSDATRARVRAALDALAPRSSPAAPWVLGTTAANALLEWPGRAER